MSPLEFALHGAINDRLQSMVYAALNEAFDSTDDPKEEMKEWREIGAWPLAETLAACTRGHESPYGRTLWISPWLAQCLRAYDAHSLIGIVEQFLEGQPLAPRISQDPAEEDQKVRRLRQLLIALNP
jgi:hypothetical protein